MALRRGENGFTAQARHLESILNGTWTTSSEFTNELGVAVPAIRKECKLLGANQKALVKQCLREVGKVWPGFGWFSWFRFWKVRRTGRKKKGWVIEERLVSGGEM